MTSAAAGSARRWPQRRVNSAPCFAEAVLLISYASFAEGANENRPPLHPSAAAKKLLRESRSGALATLMPGSGDPIARW